MAIQTFVDGQVLTAAQMTTLQGNSALTLISRTTPAAANTLAFDTVFSSTYSAYFITLENVLISTSGATLSVNMRYGSTTNTVAAWNGLVYGARAGNPTFVSNAVASSTTFLLSRNVGDSGVGPSGGILNINNVGAAGLKPNVISAVYNNFNAEMRNGGAGLNSTAQTWTGFILSASAGNISGTFGIYGMAST